MLIPGVGLTALVILFALTTMALWATNRARHPLRVLAGLAALLVLGLALLIE
jgi:hypothetical protein